jgi:O-acetyl-ADP-ribose deacetylase (regulator of RNase III)
MYLDGYRQQIIGWVLDGFSDRAIADKVNVSPSTVRYWRERNGVDRPPREKKTGSPDSGSRQGTIKFVSGDLFANSHSVQAFAQGCNCQGSMGAGIAVGFRERYPTMYEQYRAKCNAQPREFNPGDVWLWKALRQPWVFNLGTQEGVWRSRASYEAIETALGKMRELADVEEVTSIAIPRIGAGYGGLSWKKVRAIIERVFADWSGRLVVYEVFVPEETRPVAEPVPSANRRSKKASPASAPRSRSKLPGT